jgi:hypothetical protein
MPVRWSLGRCDGARGTGLRGLLQSRWMDTVMFLIACALNPWARNAFADSPLATHVGLADREPQPNSWRRERFFAAWGANPCERNQDAMASDDGTHETWAGRERRVHRELTQLPSPALTDSSRH